MKGEARAKLAEHHQELIKRADLQLLVAIIENNGGKYPTGKDELKRRMLGEVTRFHETDIIRTFYLDGNMILSQRIDFLTGNIRSYGSSPDTL